MPRSQLLDSITKSSGCRLTWVPCTAICASIISWDCLNKLLKSALIARLLAFVQYGSHGENQYRWLGAKRMSKRLSNTGQLDSRDRRRCSCHEISRGAGNGPWWKEERRLGPTPSSFHVEVLTTKCDESCAIVSGAFGAALSR